MSKKLFLGVDLGGTSMRAGVVDQDGKVLGQDKRKTKAELGAEEVLQRLLKTVHGALANAGAKAREVGGLGIGVPGPVDAKKGLVRRAIHLGEQWTDFPLGPRLAAQLGFPVLLENDVRAGAIGEYRHGAGRGTRNMVAIFAGTGIGGGIVIEGQLLRGHSGGAGEVGHTVVAAGNGVIGKTGQAGTAEPLCSRTGMQRRLEERVARGERSLVPELLATLGKGRLTSSVVAAALEARDPLMQSVLAEAQHVLGLLAANAINVLEPECIVFGGGLVERLGESYVAPIREVAQRNLLNPANREAIAILPAALGDLSGVVGAAVLARG